VHNPAFIAIYILSNESLPLMEALPGYHNIHFDKENHFQKKTITIDINGFIPGSYRVSLWMGHSHYHEIEFLKEVVNFEINEFPMPTRTIEYPNHAGFFVPSSIIR
jgi:hypothetical protein